MQFIQSKSKASTSTAVRIAAAAAAAALTATAGLARAANAPVAVTGFNVDSIAEASAPASFVTGYFDAKNGYSFYTAGLASSGGLPAGTGPFTSLANSATTFQFAPYSANNALELNPTSANAPITTTGTLTLATPGPFTSLALLEAAANGAQTISYTLNFAGGTIAAGSFTGNDWYGGTNAALQGLGRFQNTNSFDTSGVVNNNPRLYEQDIAIPAADQTLNLTSISFSDPTTTNQQWSVFAVSGAIGASTFTYTGAVNGTFDTTTANFVTAGGTATAFAANNIAVFDDSATGTTSITVPAGGVSPAGVTFNNNGKNYAFAGGPIATGQVTLNGSGTVTFNNADTYTGPTTVNNGTLVIGATGAVASTALTVGTGGTLTILSGGNLTAAAPSLADNGTVNFNNPTRVLGGLTGTGTVNLNGTALTVGAGSAYNGSFGGTGGSLNVAGGSVTFSSPSSLAVMTGGVAVAATGTVVLNDNGGQLGLNNAGGPITITSTGGTIGVPAGGSATYAGNVVAAGTATTTLATSNAGSLTLTGTLSGPAPVQVTSAGGFGGATLGGTGTYTGQLTISSGPNVTTDALYVNVTTPTALSGQGGLALGSNAAFLQVSLMGNNESVAYLSAAGGANQSITSSGGTLTITTGNASGGSASFGSAITGGLSIAKLGSGNQTLSAANSYTGGTTITAGTLTAANPTALGSATVTLNGGSLALLGAATKTYAGFAGYQVNANVAAMNAGSANITPDNTTANLTNGTQGEAATVFSPAPIGVAGGFTASFVWDHANLNTSPYSVADGFSFILQNTGKTALGGSGGGLGYTGIGSSIAVPFDTYSGYGTGFGTGFGTNGTLPAGNTYTSITPIVIQNENLAVTITYNASAQTLTESLVGLNAANSPTGDTFNATVATGLNLASVLGGTSAYVGFGGGTGGVTITQNISSFTFTTTSALTGPGAIANPVNTSTGTTSTIALITATGTTTSGVGPITLAPASTVTLVTTSTSNASTAIPRGVLTTPSVTLASTARLDIVGNDLDVTGSSLSAVTALAAAGYGKGSFNGAGGVVSSAARANAARNTTVGVILNSDPTTGQLYGSGQPLGLFDGANPGPGDVLVKYTYFGDANLDGVVNGADYARIDAGFLSGGSLTGWYNGDFNYDGKVNASDYTLIDDAFNTQAGALVTSVAGGPGITAGSTDEIAPAAGTAAVPEPATLGLLAVAGGGLLARRRRA